MEDNSYVCRSYTGKTGRVGLFDFVSLIFLLFLHLKLQLLSKFEVKENFPRFPSFRFWIWVRIENSETSEILTSSCNHILFIYLFIYLFSIYSALAIKIYNYKYTVKMLIKANGPLKICICIAGILLHIN